MCAGQRLISSLTFLFCGETGSPYVMFISMVGSTGSLCKQYIKLAMMAEVGWGWPGEIAGWLRALVVLPEDPG